MAGSGNQTQTANSWTASTFAFLVKVWCTVRNWLCCVYWAVEASLQTKFEKMYLNPKCLWSQKMRLIMFWYKSANYRKTNVSKAIVKTKLLKDQFHGKVVFKMQSNANHKPFRLAIKCSLVGDVEKWCRKMQKMHTTVLIIGMQLETSKIK